MAKPVKGNKSKRPASDESRLKKAHLNMLKRNKAIVSSSFNVPSEGFISSKVSDKLIRIKGVGAQALKMATSKNMDEVVKCIKERSWTRLCAIVDKKDNTPIDYKIEVVTKY